MSEITRTDLFFRLQRLLRRPPSLQPAQEATLKRAELPSKRRLIRVRRRPEQEALPLKAKPPAQERLPRLAELRRAHQPRRSASWTRSVATRRSLPVKVRRDRSESSRCSLTLMSFRSV